MHQMGEQDKYQYSWIREERDSVIQTGSWAIKVKEFPREDMLSHFYTTTAAAMAWPAHEFFWLPVLGIHGTTAWGPG